MWELKAGPPAISGLVQHHRGPGPVSQDVAVESGRELGAIRPLGEQATVFG